MDEDGLLPESFGDLTNIEAQAALAQVLYNNNGLKVQCYLIGQHGLSAREAASIALKPEVQRAASRAQSLFTSDWDALATSLRGPLMSTILDLLGSPKDNTRIEGARLAAQLVEKHAAAERKSRSANAHSEAAARLVAEERAAETMTDDDIFQEISARHSDALH